VSQDGQRKAVTRHKENNDTQRWRFIGFGGGFAKIQQVSSDRVLLGDLTAATDFQVFARNELPLTDQKAWRIADSELIDE
jgi:hypothetical protein